MVTFAEECFLDSEDCGIEMKQLLPGLMHMFHAAVVPNMKIILTNIAQWGRFNTIYFVIVNP